MANSQFFGELHTGPEARSDLALPAINKLTIADLRDVLARGVDDFWTMPSHIVFLGLIYPVLGLVLARFTLGQDLLPLLFPLVSGFALVGPVAATGLYELSRRREQGLAVTWKSGWGVLRMPAMRPIAGLGLVLMAVFVFWMYTARQIYIWNFGYAMPDGPEAFVTQVLATDAGHALIVEGISIGFLFAIFVLAISVVSFPMMLDRNVGAVSAVLTSIRVALRNPVVIAAWGLIVAAALAIGSIPFLVGLAVIVPVLGHATWHLYRKAVAPQRR
jgi:uncharacterized membrane protein